MVIKKYSEGKIHGIYSTPNEVKDYADKKKELKISHPDKSEEKVVKDTGNDKETERDI